MVEAALAYARRGWRVVPLHGVVRGRCTCGRASCPSPGKHPLLPRWPEAATTDPDTIQAWWRRWPRANVGIVCGAVSGLVVVDIDPRHGGDEALCELEERHGPLPETVEALTGGGGRHVYFRHPGGRVASATLAPGLELKGEAALVVAPPSIHVSSRAYSWELAHHPDDAPLAEPPAWLLERTRTPAALGTARPTDYWRQLVRNGVREGARNNAIAQISGHLLRRGVDPYVVLELLLCWNRVRCLPPLEDAEVVRTVESIAKAEARHRGLLTHVRQRAVPCRARPDGSVLEASPRRVVRSWPRPGVVLWPWGSATPTGDPPESATRATEE